MARQMVSEDMEKQDAEVSGPGKSGSGDLRGSRGNAGDREMFPATTVELT